MIGFFDSVVCISLDQRGDRWAEYERTLAVCGWPFAPPERVRGIDGAACRNPTTQPGVWGCLQSHRRVIEDAILDNRKRVLVMEDDADFHPNFGAMVSAFLSAVPGDWDMLMLGGQHRRAPVRVADGVVRCRKTERTHCYAVAAKYLPNLYRLISCRIGHVDMLMSAGNEGAKVYAPEKFIVAQRSSLSDINGRVWSERWWQSDASEPERRKPRGA